MNAKASSAPDRSTLVLVSLILVAAVANLNLAVANVALPSIAEEFDSGQTALNLIAVGYSLGLAASVLYFGAIGDRYGRKLMLVARHGAVDSGVPARGLGADGRGALRRAPARRALRGHGVPDDARADHGALVGPGRTKSIALWSGIGGAISSLGPVLSGALLEQFWWGSVFLITLPLAAVALVAAVMYVPSHVNEASDPVDNLGGILSVVLVAALVLSINFAPVPDKGMLALGLAAIAVAGLDRVPAPPASRVESALRPRRCPSPHLLGGRVCGGDRVRDADGRDVRRPAVPAERAGLLDARGGAVDPARRRLHGAGRAALGQARRSTRRSVHAAGRLLLLPARLPHHAAALERGHLVLERRACVRARRRSGSGSPARPPPTRSPAPCRCGGRAWPRAPPTSSATSAARSCSRSSALS